MKKLIAILSVSVLVLVAAGCRSAQQPIVPALTVAPQAPVKAPFNPKGTFVHYGSSGLQAHDATGKVLFSLSKEEFDPHYVLSSASLLAYVDPRDSLLRLVSLEEGKVLYTKDFHELYPSSVKVEGGFLFFEKIGNSYTVVNLQGKEIIAEDDWADREFGSRLIRKRISHLDEYHLYSDIGVELIPPFQDGYRPEISGEYFSYVTPSTQKSRWILHVNKGSTELFTREVYDAREYSISRISSSLLAYTVKTDGVVYLVVENLQGQEILREKYSNFESREDRIVTMEENFMILVRQGEGRESPILDIHLNDGRKHLSLKEDQIRELKISEGLVLYLTEGVFHAFNSEGTEVLVLPESDVGTYHGKGFDINLSAGFIQYRDSSGTENIISSAGVKVFTTTEDDMKWILN
jgi:hypothetical protein